MPGAKGWGIWCVSIAKFSKVVKRKEVFEANIKRIENFFPYSTWEIWKKPKLRVSIQKCLVVFLITFCLWPLRICKNIQGWLTSLVSWHKNIGRLETVSLKSMKFHLILRQNSCFSISLTKLICTRTEIMFIKMHKNRIFWGRIICLKYFCTHPTPYKGELPHLWNDSV